MKNYKSNEIKNIALIGGAGTGKTTLSEAMLFESGAIKRRGSVSAKTTVSDFYPVEQEYGYSVYATPFALEWADKKLNIIDCPGSDDFVGGAVTSLNVTDCAMILIHGQSGFDGGVMNSFRNTETYNKPAMFAVNQLDRENVDFDAIIERLREAYGNNVIPAQFPVNAGEGFNQIIDVLSMKSLTYKGEGDEPVVADIPAAYQSKAEELHGALVEAAAESDEALMEKFFEEGDLSAEEVHTGLRKALLARGVFPVFCVSAEKLIGVRHLLDILCDIAPAVSEAPAVKNGDGQEIAYDDAAPCSIFFFKTTFEQHIGEVNYFKVMTGVMHEGEDMVNANRGSKERVALIYSPVGSNRIQVGELHSGDIGATVKLKDVKTGNTLNSKGCDNKYDFIVYPDPKYRRAIKPLNEADMEKMMGILQRIREEDPTYLIEQSRELKQTILHGQGEFHLRTLKWTVENIDKLAVEFNEPKIPYRETITKAARADYRHKKQSGGSGQFGEVHLIIEPYEDGKPMPETFKFGNQEFKMSVKGVDEFPLEWGGKLIFVNSIVGGAIDARFIPAIQKGIMSRMEQGPLTGSYARDIRVIVYDGKMHPVDSNEISFMLAGRNAFSMAFKEAGPKVLEPIYDVEILVPGENMGDVMSDLNGRRAIIMGMHSDRGMQKLQAKVPLKEMSDYSTSLSSISGGRASFTMKFASYELVPADVQSQLLKDYEAQQQDKD